MYRIKDNYNWKRLEHWKMVLDKGNVVWKSTERVEVEDAVLEEAIMLLKNNCFPIAIVCCCKEDYSREILGTSLWNGIFSFLGGERCIRRNGRTIFFEDMEEKEKREILDAHIFSIWIKN